MANHDEDEAVTTWTAQIGGLRKLPQRIAFNSIDFGRLLWWTVFAVVPAVLLAFGSLVSDKGTYAYHMYCAFLMTATLQSSERFISMTAKLDQGAGELVSTYHMGEPTLFRSDEDVSTSFEDVESARFVTLADQTVVRLYYRNSFTNKPTVFLVPSDIEDQFRESLRQHDVSIRGESEEDSTGWVWVRFVITVLLLGVIPVSAVFIWPVGSWVYVLAFIINSIFILRQGW
ncbi:hypothetical protein HFX_6063 (plasmid) [Haloferax mediterranei ATCC 33500]|uniref:Uncharacterized protein n=1 Tax=Haloferax mediterranei (strain ATCC 33500 / DSM 1411 / JCM 8866 / NBRC 14739 / NCIMB 2177 / R-4) TaxID=523841 RepID=I3RAD0_HALMT|nr:hypothetical protein HFX_6063 [Haloferax mediterranei ATCC 33500]AHZ24696.1 hypothetical protein BM92_17600 [Haloferax mediterranei ATCC 33500]